MGDLGRSSILSGTLRILNSPTLCRRALRTPKGMRGATALWSEWRAYRRRYFRITYIFKRQVFSQRYFNIYQCHIICKCSVR